MVTIGELITVIRAIYDQFKLVKNNDNHCNTLQERLNVLTPILSTLDVNNPKISGALDKFKKCLDDCLQLMKKLKKLSSWAAFRQADDIDKQFDAIANQLRDTQQALQTTMIASSIFDAARDRVDAAADRKKLSEAVAEVKQGVSDLNKQVAARADSARDRQRAMESMLQQLMAIMPQLNNDIKEQDDENTQQIASLEEEIKRQQNEITELKKQIKKLKGKAKVATSVPVATVTESKAEQQRVTPPARYIDQLYKEGKGYENAGDLDAAVKLYEQARTQEQHEHLIKSLYCLGTMYCDDPKGGPKDMPRAYGYFHAAAILQYPPAMLIIAEMLEQRNEKIRRQSAEAGVTKDLHQAFLWFKNLLVCAQKKPQKFEFEIEAATKGIARIADIARGPASNIDSLLSDSVSSTTTTESSVDFARASSFSGARLSTPAAILTSGDNAMSPVQIMATRGTAVFTAANNTVTVTTHASSATMLTSNLKSVMPANAL